MGIQTFWYVTLFLLVAWGSRYTDLLGLLASIDSCHISLTQLLQMEHDGQKWRKNNRYDISTTVCQVPSVSWNVTGWTFLHISPSIAVICSIIFLLNPPVFSGIYSLDFPKPPPFPASSSIGAVFTMWNTTCFSMDYFRAMDSMVNHHGSSICGPLFSPGSPGSIDQEVRGIAKARLSLGGFVISPFHPGSMVKKNHPKCWFHGDSYGDSLMMS